MGETLPGEVRSRVDLLCSISFQHRSPRRQVCARSRDTLGTLHSNKFVHNKSLPKRKLIPLTERTHELEQKFIVCYKAPSSPRRVPPGEFSLYSRRISRTFKLIGTNLLFHGNVNTKFIKFRGTQRASERQRSFPG